MNQGLEKKLEGCEGIAGGAGHFLRCGILGAVCAIRKLKRVPETSCRPIRDAGVKATPEDSTAFAARHVSPRVLPATLLFTSGAHPARRRTQPDFRNSDRIGHRIAHFSHRRGGHVDDDIRIEFVEFMQEIRSDPALKFDL